MDKSQLDTIKRIIEHSYEEIVKMSDMVFWKTVTQAMVKGRITPQQHEWLDKQRTTQDLTQQEIDALNIFGGKVYGKD